MQPSVHAEQVQDPAARADDHGLVITDRETFGTGFASEAAPGDGRPTTGRLGVRPQKRVSVELASFFLHSARALHP